MPLAAVIVTYLLSSISFPYWVARANGVDLRAVGERKLGGGNLAKSVGLAQGILGGTLDGAKGFLAVLVTRVRPQRSAYLPPSQHPMAPLPTTANVTSAASVVVSAPAPRRSRSLAATNTAIHVHMA